MRLGLDFGRAWDFVWMQLEKGLIENMEDNIGPLDGQACNCITNLHLLSFIHFYTFLLNKMSSCESFPLR
jgi:hypothetical protein